MKKIQHYFYQLKGQTLSRFSVKPDVYAGNPRHLDGNVCEMCVIDGPRGDSETVYDNLQDLKAYLLDDILKVPQGKLMSMVKKGRVKGCSVTYDRAMGLWIEALEDRGIQTGYDPYDFLDDAKEVMSFDLITELSNGDICVKPLTWAYGHIYLDNNAEEPDGAIWTTRDKVCAAAGYDPKKVSKDDLNALYDKAINAEVDAFDRYLNGMVYAVTEEVYHPAEGDYDNDRAWSIARVVGGLTGEIVNKQLDEKSIVESVFGEVEEAAIPEDAIRMRTRLAADIVRRNQEDGIERGEWISAACLLPPPSLCGTQRFTVLIPRGGLILEMDALYEPEGPHAPRWTDNSGKSIEGVIAWRCN